MVRPFLLLDPLVDQLLKLPVFASKIVEESQVDLVEDVGLQVGQRDFFLLEFIGPTHRLPKPAPQFEVAVPLVGFLVLVEIVDENLLETLSFEILFCLQDDFYHAQEALVEGEVPVHKEVVDQLMQNLVTLRIFGGGRGR